MNRDGAKIYLIIILSQILTDILVVCDKQLYIVSQVDVMNFPGQSVKTEFTLVGRNRAINGTATLLEDLTNNDMVSVLLYSDPLGIGDFKLMPMEVRPIGICTALKAYYRRFIKGSIETNVHTNFNFKDGKVCPLPRGKYWLKDVIFSTTGWVNILPIGIIKAELKLQNKNTFLGGFAIVVNIESRILL